MINHSRAVLLICIVTLGRLAYGQEQSARTQAGERLEGQSPDRTTQAVVPQQTPVALESTVDPVRYYVGPSDVIGVNIWMSPPLSFPLMVTPEGTLIVPTVGEIPVANLTLADAKAKIIREARKKYITAQITATLVRPRPIIVSVTGNVLNPGLLTLAAVDRANKAIDQANVIGRLQTDWNLQTILRDMSTRNVVLKHRDGSSDRVDIPKYFATHEDRWNPYLREGDVIIVPRKDRMKNIIAVYGQVNAPGQFEYVEGDSLLDAIRLAHGTTPLALTDQVIFSRLNEDGTALVNQTVNLADITAGRAPNVALQPGDRIVIQGRNDLREDYSVEVRGEVKFPATYPIARNSTRLSEVIRQAGGFTEYASLRTATVIRQSFQPEQLENEQLMSMRGGVATSDSAGFGLETTLRLKRETVNVDFDRLFGRGDSSQDIILQARDEIIIPPRTQSIYVFGQVASPGHVPFVAGKDPGYYVTKAGGFTDRANSGGLKIIKAKTKQWVPPEDTQVEEGDYVWVPTEPDKPFGYYMNVASQMASVLSVIIGVGVIIVQLTKP